MFFLIIEEQFRRSLSLTLCMNNSFRLGTRMMKLDKIIVAIIAAGWVIFLLILSAFSTPMPLTTSWLIYMTTVILLAHLLIRPLTSFMMLFIGTCFLRKKKKGCYWIHLQPWLKTGHLGLRRLSCLWQELIATLRLTLIDSPRPIVMSSHLLRPNRITRLRHHFPAKHYLFHIIKRPVGRTERVGLQIVTLLNEWRWFTPSVNGAVVIIRLRKLSLTEK